MILPFSTHLNGQQTYFVEKILAALRITRNAQVEEYINRFYADRFGGWYEVNRSKLATCHPKVHTIRADEKDRWHDGRLIHPVIFNRTKKQLQFAPAVKCWKVQEFSIEYTRSRPECEDITVKVDGRVLSHAECERLALNDGFESLLEFTRYFASNFTGKIIHWTDMQY